jgi:hypothetical protein
MIHLARSDFYAAMRLVDVTFDEGQLVSATLSVRSDQFDRERDQIGYPVFGIEDIDLSHGFQGFAFAFRVNRTPLKRIPPEQPVRIPAKTQARKPTAPISIVVSSVYINYSMPSGYVSRLICEGHIKNRADQLDGSECSIELLEYDQQDSGYPREALSGNFAWHKDARSLSVDLRYREVDLAGPLGVFIFAGASDLVRIEATLLADIAEFKLGDQHGEISYWAVHMHRKLGDAKPK